MSAFGTATFPLKKVIRTEVFTTKYCRPNEGSRKHFLECGHFNWTKQSYGLPKRMRCRDCALKRTPEKQP